jgi:hypothetical protein
MASAETSDATPRERFDGDPWHNSHDPQPWFRSGQQNCREGHEHQESLQMEGHDASSE